MHAILLIVIIFSPTFNGAHLYRFFRDINRGSFVKGTRRIFGGFPGNISVFPGACLLADDEKKIKCSGSIITPRFVITAAHCITPKLKYVFYNNRVPKSGNVVTISRVYRHPGFNYVTVDEGRGLDVTQLYHDVGLVESRGDMSLASKPHKEFFRALRTEPTLLSWQEVDVLGFGLASKGGNNDELQLVKLRVNPCERSTWRYCICGQVLPGETARGVCAGDSGGPVLVNGTQIAVTSMGPVECSSTQAQPGFTATSVFTLVSRYEQLIKNTINHEGSRMREVQLNLANSYLNHNDDTRSVVFFDVNSLTVSLFMLLKIF